jgi:hypothetical protein
MEIEGFIKQPNGDLWRMVVPPMNVQPIVEASPIVPQEITIEKGN